jgi:hypothetical protein
MKIYLNRLKSLFQTAIKEKIYYLSKAQIVENANNDAPGSQFGIGTIAFNNSLVINYQIRLLKKYLLDSHVHIIFDNSNNAVESEQIRNICSQNKTAYIRLPMNPLHTSVGSGSHAYALNWVYKNYFKRLRYTAFGFLDHDVFPIKPTRILERLKTAHFWGLKHYRDNLWYLWPGFCFYNLENIYNKKINFSGYKNMDNGGANWKSLYRYHDGDFQNLEYNCADINELLNTDLQNWSKMMISRADYKEKNPRLLDGDEFVEFFGDWVHLFNASNWRGLKDKNDKIQIFMRHLTSTTTATGEIYYAC